MYLKMAFPKEACVLILLITTFWFAIVLGNPDSIARMCTPTSPDEIGPYYYPDAPSRKYMCVRDPTFHHVMHLLVHGNVQDESCNPIPGAKVEIWQADHGGHYLFRQNCRGHLYTNRNGGYVFLTIHPGKYTVVPGTNLFRPAHVHFMVKKPGYKTLVTQMYFQGDSNLGRNDSCSMCSSDRNDLIVDPEVVCAGGDDEHCYASATFNLVLEQGEGYAVVWDTYDSPEELYDLIDKG